MHVALYAVSNQSRGAPHLKSDGDSQAKPQYPFGGSWKVLVAYLWLARNEGMDPYSSPYTSPGQ